MDDTGPKTPPFRAVGFLVSTVGYAVSRSFKAVLAPVGLEPREWALLRAVGFDEGQSQQALAERLQIPPSRMVAIVDNLEQRGFVERRQKPDDRRARALYLTPAGRQTLAEALKLVSAFERRLCADLEPGEREQLIDLLERVAAQLDLTPGVHAAVREQ